MIAKTHQLLIKMIVLLRKGNQWEKIEIMNKRQEPRSCHFKKEEKQFEELIMF